jgi:hypothetical protein
MAKRQSLMEINAKPGGIVPFTLRTQHRFRALGKPPQLVASFVISNHRRNVSCWHKADIPDTPAFVRYWSNSGHCLAQALNGLVANDP